MRGWSLWGREGRPRSAGVGAYEPLPLGRSVSRSVEDGEHSFTTHPRSKFAPLERQLSERQMSMIAIGGIIGPGLLVGSGGALAAAGPAGALIAFLLTGGIVFCVMQSLGELAAYAPVSGSFTTYAGRFVDPSFSFALGWTYWWLWITVLCNEYNNIGILLFYWPQAQIIPEIIWTLLFWCIIFAFSFLGVWAYGEAEYWLTLVKVTAISVFFVVALLIDVGGIGDPPNFIGARYWSDPGAFSDGFEGIAKIVAVTGTLYAGCESVGVIAGEAANPTRSIPKAIRSVFLRIAFFYIGTMVAIGLLIPYDNPRLLSATSKASASPFTIALEAAGIKSGAAIMNCVILITVISAGNSALYLASRILVGLAREGRAPAILGTTNSRGVPWPALLLSNGMGLLSLLKYIGGTASGQVFSYLMSLSGVSTFVCWAAIALCHIRFRQAYEVQGRALEDLPFRARWFPYGAYLALASNLFLCVFQGYTTLSPFSFPDFIAAYLVLPVFAVLFLYWKRKHRTEWIKVEDMDLDSDRREVELETEHEHAGPYEGRGSV